jgi:AcrR family transcriptional regulator
MDVPSPANPNRTFSKKSPEVRRQELIEATLRCMSSIGTEEISVRHIAREANLSLGMVRHHFNSKDELLAATLRHLSDQHNVQTGLALAAAGPDPGARLRAFILACLHPGTMETAYVRARFQFFSLAQTNATVREVHDEIYANFERKIRTLLTDVATSKKVDMDVEDVTLAITALLKGIWVEWSLTPGRADPQRLAGQILRMLPGWSGED